MQKHPTLGLQRIALSRQFLQIRPQSVISCTGLLLSTSVNPETDESVFVALTRAILAVDKGPYDVPFPRIGTVDRVEVIINEKMTHAAFSESRHPQNPCASQRSA